MAKSQCYCLGYHKILSGSIDGNVFSSVCLATGLAHVVTRSARVTRGGRGGGRAASLGCNRHSTSFL